MRVRDLESVDEVASGTRPWASLRASESSGCMVGLRPCRDAELERPLYVADCLANEHIC